MNLEQRNQRSLADSTRPASKPRTVLFPILAVIVGALSTYLMVEGVHSLAQGPTAAISLGYSFYLDYLKPERAVAQDPRDATTRMISSLSTINVLLDSMKANGVGLGNSPFSELKTEAVSINDETGPCLRQKPNVRKHVGFLRGNLFNPFDQMTYFVDADRELPAELREFFDRYAFRTVLHGTNAFGERRTLPDVGAARVVLIAGDSVANGLVLDDSETLASRLQAADRLRRYVNLGIARADTADIFCALEQAASRYRGRIDEVIFVLCENDFAPSSKPVSGDELTARLESFRKREGVGNVTLVYVPYIYNAAPEITRVRGHSHYAWPTFREQKTRVLESAASRGFRTLDFLEVVEAERRRAGSQFAALALYADQAHWSPLGTERTAAALRVLLP